VFNLDELVISDWEDLKKKKVLVGAAMIQYEVSRNVKHISVIACMSAAGESLLPSVVTSQNSPAGQKHLKKQAVRFGTDSTVQFNQMPYINAGIFFDDIRSIFLPYIGSLRGLAVFAQEIAFLLMANFSAHVSDDMIRILTKARLRVTTSAPHTDQVFQVLDLTLIGVLKRRPMHELPFNDDTATAKSIMKGYHDFWQTMIQRNIWGSLRALGVEFDVRIVPYRLLFDEIKLKKKAGFQEL
jgi:hypothetical protein